MSRPPYETVKGPTCKGSLAFGNGCGRCEKCDWERAQIAAAVANPVQVIQPAPRLPRQTFATYDLGRDTNGRPVMAHRVQPLAGPGQWTITSESPDQPDGPQRIVGLSDANMRAIAEILT